MEFKKDDTVILCNAKYTPEMNGKVAKVVHGPAYVHWEKKTEPWAEGIAYGYVVRLLGEGDSVLFAWPEQLRRPDSGNNKAPNWAAGIWKPIKERLGLT